MSPSEVSWPEELRERLRSVFVAEAADRLDELDAVLVALGGPGGPPDPAHLLGPAYLHAHTIKGGARAVGLDGMEAVAEALESLFDRLREGAAPEPATWAAASAAVAALRALLAGDDADTAGVVAALQAAAPQGGTG